MEDIQRYYKILTQDGDFSAFVSHRHIPKNIRDFRIKYPQNKVVWTKPKTVGIFVFTDLAKARHHRRRDAKIVEVFPLGWQIKPPFVFYADTLFMYNILWKEGDTIKTLIEKITKQANYSSNSFKIQDLWDCTVCCEGVLVGKEVT